MIERCLRHQSYKQEVTQHRSIGTEAEVWEEIRQILATEVICM